MALPSILQRRPLLKALTVAGFLAGTAGAASAQYYRDAPFEGGYGYAPRGAYGESYGVRDRYEERDAPVPPRRIGQISVRQFGLTRIDRMVHTGTSYVVDGPMLIGERARLIFDSRSGDLVDRIILQAAPQARPKTAPRVARAEPREFERSAPRLVPRPPERPAALRPPAQATAPAGIVPPAPVVVPSAGPVAPSGIEKPALVSPPATAAPVETAAPLAKAPETVLDVPPVVMPPLNLEGIAPAEAPAAPAD